MGQITTGIGLISGIDTGSLINSLISLDSGPVTILQSQITSTQNQEAAYTDLETDLNSLQTVGKALALPQTFQNANASSSNPNVLTATAAVGAAVGSYQLQVSRLVTTQQSISQGFADATTALVGAGTLTLEAGGGEASNLTPLANLNGGTGVQRGQFRITDGSNNSAVIDTSNAVSLDDVVKQINTALGISIHASVTDKGLVLTDNSGGTGKINVQDLGGGSSAQSLGIAGQATGTLTGTNINYLTSGTSLAQLNDGKGIRTTSIGQNDFTLTLGDGSTVAVSLAGSKTVGDVLTAINKAGGGKLKADLNPNANGIRLTDNSGGGGALTVTANNGSAAATDLGITGAAAGNVITGAPILAGLDSVLISSLKGGAGLPLGTISITDRLGNNNQIDLSGATSVSDIINTINAANPKVQASLNAAGTGLKIVDTSGGTGNLVIGDVSSTSASALGIAGTFDNTVSAVNGANLQRQYVSENTLLSSYNGGNGVTPGQFQIVNSTGATATVDLGTGTFNTIGDVISIINAKKIGVTASINANGNGLLLTDTAGGAQKLTVKDLGGTAAADLNIAGVATATTIDGAEEKSISVSATDTLTTLQTKINQAGFGVVANIINDGSATSPFRLSLTSVNSGQAGRVLIDGGTTNLNVTHLVDAQDAAVFIGGDGSNQPLLISSNKNQITNVIKGVTINLVGASSSPVTLSVAQSSDNIVTQLASFTTDFNSLIDKISTDTQFNTTTNQGAILLGDGTTQQIQSSLYNMVNTEVSGAGKYHDLADIGITITDGAKLTFDTNTFLSAFGTDPTAVQNLFSQTTTGLGNVINNSMTALTDPVNGIVTLQNNSLATRVTQFQTRMTELNAILANKRTQLETEFANMETTLATLQSQGSLLSTLNTTATTTPAKTTSTASSTSAPSSSSSSSSSTGSSSTSTTGG
jgi:flagellar hook-associated protein 2